MARAAPASPDPRADLLLALLAPGALDPAPRSGRLCPDAVRSPRKAPTAGEWAGVVWMGLALLLALLA